LGREIGRVPEVPYHQAQLSLIVIEVVIGTGNSRSCLGCPISHHDGVQPHRYLWADKLFDQQALRRNNLVQRFLVRKLDAEGLLRLWAATGHEGKAPEVCRCAKGRHCGQARVGLRLLFMQSAAECCYGGAPINNFFFCVYLFIE